MEVNDIIRTRFVGQVDGVATSNTQFWKVASVPTTDTVSDTIKALAALWWSKFSAYLANSVTLACADWDNQTRNEVQVTYPGLPGTGGAGDHHPALSVVNISLEGWDAAETPVVTVGKSRNAISGWLESVSTRGRLNQDVNLLPLRLFHTQQQLIAAGEAALVPMVRHDSAGKAWRDGGKVGPQPSPTYVYLESQTAQVDSRIRTLRGRKTVLCA